MSEEKRVSDAQKRAHKKYMSSFVEIKVRMTPERRSAIQAHAQAMRESATVFINRAIDHEMERDGHRSPQEATKNGAVSLPSEEYKAAPAASESQTEEV